MIKRIKTFFQLSIICDQQEHPAVDIQLAAAALFVEIMFSDGILQPSEEDAIKQRLQHTFSLDDSQVIELLAMGQEQVKDATSLHQFTRLINEHFTDAEKEMLVESLWHIAKADGVIDKHEEATIRKISELIYVSHSAFIRAKKRAGH